MRSDFEDKKLILWSWGEGSLAWQEMIDVN